MLKKLSFLIASLFFTINSYAQYQSVSLDLKTKLFNNGAPLPAEKNFNIAINTQSNIDFINVQFLKKIDKEPFYTTFWNRSVGELGTLATLPVNIKLKSNTGYAFRIKSYRKLLQSDKLKIASQLSISTKNFIESSVVRGNKGYDFKMSEAKVMENLDGILTAGLSTLEVSYGKRQESFSDVIKVMLKNLEDTKYKDLIVDTADLSFKRSITAINRQMDNELINIINSYAFVLTNVAEIDSYETEKTMKFLSVNAGYGGIYRSGQFNNVNYSDGFFAGVSFPLANYALNNSFISKTSFSTGFFIKDFSVGTDSVITGPLVNRPIFAAVGYRFLNFMKISVGTSIVQEKNTLLNTTSVIKLKPFIGLGIELDFWLGLKKD